MRIERLDLSQWRNFEQASVTFSPTFNFVTGENGSGKTNLLEAVAYLSQARSFRKAPDKDLIRQGQSLAAIRGSFVFTSSEYTKQVDALIRAGGKAIKVDDKKASTLSSFFGTVSVVSFDPKKVFLFRSEPSERRRAMDETLSGIYPKYLYSLSRYKKLLKQRNQALVQKADEDVLTVYTRELINSAWRLVSNRAEMVKEAGSIANAIFKELFDSKAELALTYRTDMPPTDDFETFKSEATALFERKRSAERLRRATVVGPHLDDISCALNGLPIQNYGSQGQNRLAALSFVLALAQITGQKRQEKPILVLDDVLSDLDSKRKARLCEFSLSLGQTIVSGSLEDVPKGAKKIVVADGRIIPEKEGE